MRYPRDVMMKYFRCWISTRINLGPSSSTMTHSRLRTSLSCLSSKPQSRLSHMKTVPVSWSQPTARYPHASKCPQGHQKSLNAPVPAWSHVSALDSKELWLLIRPSRLTSKLSWWLSLRPRLASKEVWRLRRRPVGRANSSSSSSSRFACIHHTSQPRMLSQSLLSSS